ncbi:MAG TPA: glycosyl transferase, partial [Rhodospirillaceae bacterium]|nr:glycosyl transferase [Rhodospirillaceae bacterium]
HRLLLRKDIIGFCLRGVEGVLSRFAKALITSSPAFIENYFTPLSRVRLPITLIENKVIDAGLDELQDHENEMVNTSPPWIIGWFGVIRCRKSLDMLIKLVKASQGRVEVVIRGKPALDQLDGFYQLVSDTKGLRFLGAYSNPHDLEKIYSDVHFTWAIDKYEEGLNSSWLLPNRIYEGGTFGAVPIAQEQVETGRFIRALGIGVTIVEPEEQSLKRFFDELTEEHYRAMRDAALAVPRSTWVYTAKDCAAFVDGLRAI